MSTFSPPESVPASAPLLRLSGPSPVSASASISGSPAGAVPAPAGAGAALDDELAKRLLDLVGASVLIVAAMPLMLALAAVVKLTSPGPVI